MIWLYAYCILALAGAGALALWRVERGPSTLDRVVALDVVTAAVLGTVTIIAAMAMRSDLVPVLIVLSVVGFIGSVAVARFSAAESQEEARILTREELAALAAEEAVLNDEAAAVHDPDDSDDLGAAAAGDPDRPPDPREQP